MNAFNPMAQAKQVFPQWTVGARVWGDLGAATVVFAGRTLCRVRWDGGLMEEAVDSRRLIALARHAEAMQLVSWTAMETE